MRIYIWLVSLFLFCFSFVPVYAQDSQAAATTKSTEISQIDEQLASIGDEEFKRNYLSWQGTISTAKALVADKNTSSTQLDRTRADLVDTRETAEGYLDYNQGEVQELQNRLSALGPAPADGLTEAEEVASLRTQLGEQISKANLPRVLAGQIVDETSRTISQIDSEFRSRYGQRLMTRNSSPLMPSAWQLTYLDLRETSQNIQTEIAKRLEREDYRFAIMRNWPTMLGALVLGLALLFANRRLLEPIYERLLRWSNIVERDFFRLFLAILRDLAFPLLGSLLIVYAFRQTGFFGHSGEFLLADISKIVIGFVITKWLANAYKSPRGEGFLGLSGRKSILMQLGALMTLNWVLVDFVAKHGLSLQTQSVFTVVLVIFGSLLLRRAVKIFAISDIDANPEDQFAWVLPTSKTFIRSVCVIAPSLAVLGYTAAAHYLLFGVLNTIALILAAYLLYELASGLLAYIIPSVQKSLAEVEKGDDLGAPKSTEQDERRLWPILLAGVTGLCTFPFVLHAWGMRYSDIQELWAVINRGFMVGAARVSPLDLLRILFVLYIGFWLVRFGKRVLGRTILPRTDIDIGTQTAIVSLFGYFGYLIATIWALRTSGLDLSSIAIVAGALSVGIGFGLQTIVSNFISGIILLVERPIKKGDWIKVNEYEGYVQQINVRATEIETFDMGSVIVPNADLISAPVLNWTHRSKVKRCVVNVGVAYKSDTEQVTDILLEIANAQPQVLRRPAANVVFVGFGADSLDFQLRFYLREADMEAFVASKVRYSINERFRTEGIDIPFSQRVVRVIRDDEDDEKTDVSKQDD